jgi:glutathione synthase/RimK-type ligase-like ATP-grasp enzyme
MLHMGVLIGYTLIGVAISIAASMDSIFQFSKKASALSILASDARGHSRHYMSALQWWPNPNSPEALRETKKLVDEMNKELESISRKSADLGVDLALANPINYSQLLEEKQVT